MLRDIDEYFDQKEEPAKSCMLYLRKHILGLHPDMTETWKYRMPVYCLKGKMFCYLWTHKKYGNQPYIGIVDGQKIEHPQLIQEKRARMKIMLIDPAKDVPVETVDLILGRMLALRTEN